MWHRGIRLMWMVATTITLVACGSGGGRADGRSADETSATLEPTFTSTPSATAEPRVKNWFDLDVGDCLVELPRVDLGEVSVSIVDCTSPHAGEVFLRAPVEVNAAVADVADAQCAAGVAAYTGRRGEDFAITYLIDSNQDRTSDNPLPSTVICLLQGDDGRQLTESAVKR